MNDLNQNNNNKFTITPFFASPLMQVQLDLDLEKLTEFAFEMRNKDKRDFRQTDRGGWHGENILNENHEEFIRLKKEIDRYLQSYHSEIFKGIKFKTNVTQNISNIWVNFNDKHHGADWHIHIFSTLSGVYYIKVESGDILFKHPEHPQMHALHWPPGIVETYNDATSGVVNITPKPNMLLIFPAWMNHSAETNLNNDPRITVAFTSRLQDPQLKIE